jgi:putative beta barrel porin BBP7
VAYFARTLAGPLALLLAAAVVTAQQPDRTPNHRPQIAPQRMAPPVARAAADDVLSAETLVDETSSDGEYYSPGPRRPLRPLGQRIYTGDESCGDCCSLSGLYVRGEYLLWGTKGMRVPALVTTGDAATTDPPAGVINEDGSIPSNTTVLFGNDEIHSQARSGGRIIFGTFLGPCRQWAIEGEYFALADENTNFRAASDGTELIGIPYFEEAENGLPAVFFVTPGGSETDSPGSIDVFAATRFQGSGVRVLHTLCLSDCCGTSWWDGCPINIGRRVDMIIGYRFYRLDDTINIREQHLITTVERVGLDLFDAKNEFHGLDLGTQMQFRRGCWSLDLLSKVAIGNTRSVVTIDGIAFQDGQEQTPRGSILAQTTNIGIHQSDEFTMVPEMAIGIGYQINPCWRFTAGYSVIYWCSVQRAGDQIDQHVNSELWPPRAAQPEEAGLWPQFRGIGSDFWAQGLNLGLEATW